MSGELAGERDRLVQQRETAPPTAGELRIEYASLRGRVGGLVAGVRSELELASVRTGGLVSPGEEVTVGSAVGLFGAGQGRFALG